MGGFGFVVGGFGLGGFGGEKVEQWEWLLMTAALIVGIGLILILGVLDE